MRLRTPSPPPDLAPAASTRTEPADELSRARRRARSRDRWRRAGIAVLAVALLSGLTWVVGYSDLLAVQQVRLDGVDGDLAQDVLQAAQAPVGQPLARVDTDAVADRAGSVADVAAVVVSRSWPDTLVLTVTLREPVANLPRDGTWRVVDADGVVFGDLDGPIGDLPVLVSLEADADDDTAAQRRVAGVSVAAALPREMLRTVERVEVSSQADVRLVLRDGRIVIWGSAEQPERKTEVLEVLLDTPATAYDVSVPDRPTLRPAP